MTCTFVYVYVNESHYTSQKFAKRSTGKLVISRLFADRQFCRLFVKENDFNCKMLKASTGIENWNRWNKFSITKNLRRLNITLCEDYSVLFVVK